MILDRHWWKTVDGRLVPDGDPAARILAYPRGHEVPDHLAEKVGLVAAVKQQARPQDKMAAKPVDKAAAGTPGTPQDVGLDPGAAAAQVGSSRRPPKSGPGSGIEAWRAYVAGLPGSPPADELAELSRDDLIELAGD